jgi:putative transposase
MAQLKAFKYRLYPTRAQEKRLRVCLDAARNWYNMCVAERKYAWDLEGRSVGKFEPLRLVKRYKTAFRKFSEVHSHILQVATTDCDKAFGAFFRRAKAGETPGYPRFKGDHHFDSFGFKEYGNGFKLDGRRLKLSAVGRIAVRWHRPIEGTVKTLRIRRAAGQWYACFTCEVADSLPLAETGQSVGIDVGVSALFTTSTGEKVENPQWYRSSQRKLRVAQRALARTTPGGQNRKKALLAVQRLHEKVANTRADFLHKLTRGLVHRYDLIALEDLRITNLTRNPHLAKSILDSGWGMFRDQLIGKAVNAGRRVILVNPAFTSKTCSQCGTFFENLTLSDRWIECACGLSLDRDHNAAINILRRAGRDTSVELNVGAVTAMRALEAAGL